LKTGQVAGTFGGPQEVAGTFDGRREASRVQTVSSSGAPVPEPEVLRYPIGRFRPRPGLSGSGRRALIDDIAALPAAVRTAVSGLTAEQQDTPYRSGGWTVRQVVHHLADSHVNSYVRFKLAVTEDEPEITTYDEAAWAELADAMGEDVEVSLLLLESLHRRWTHFLWSLGPEAFDRAIRHPELGRVTLETNLQLYAWHGRHHLAHITRLREREAW
jgi:hypothetical protein